MIPAGVSSTSFRWIPTAFRFVTIPWAFAIRGSVVAFRWRNVRVKGAPAGVSRQPSPSRSKYPARSSRSFTLSRIVTTRPWSTPFCTRYWGTEALNQNAFAGVTTESAMSVDGSICRISSRSSALVTATRNAGSPRGTCCVFIPRWRNVKPGSDAAKMKFRLAFVGSWNRPQGVWAVRSFGTSGTATKSALLPIRSHAAASRAEVPVWNRYWIASRYGRPRQWFGFAVIVRDTPGTEAPRAKRPLAFAAPVGVAYAIGREIHFPRKSPPPRVNVNRAVVESTTATENPERRPAVRYR